VGQLGPYISTTNAVGIFGASRLVQGYTGNLFRLVRASDSATLDVAPQASDDRPNYSTIDAWIGASTATVDTLYDQSGAGNHLVQPTAAIQPLFANVPLLAKNGTRPIIHGLLGAFPSNSVKGICTFNIPTTLQVNRNAMTFLAAHNPVNPIDQCALFEFLTAGQSGTSQAVHYWNILNRYAINGNVSDLSTIYPAGQPHFIGVTSASGVNFYVRDASPVAKTAFTSAGMTTGGNVGKSYVSSNFELRGEIFALAFYSAALDSTSVGNVRTAWTSKFGLANANAQRLVYSGSSLIVGIGSTSNQAAHRYMSGLGNIELYPCGVTGRSMATEYANRATYDYSFYDATKTCVLFADAPSNDIVGQTFTSQADAETWAGDFLGVTNTGRGTNTAIPLVTAAKAQGFHNVVLPSVVARGIITTANFAEYARLKYNELLVANAAANGYVVSDRAAFAGFNDSNSAYYFSDHTHLNDAGYQVMAGIDQTAAIQAFL
jgi:hypothetical protein